MSVCGMALWRKHRFISLQEEDGKDRIAAGSQFIVKRVGSTSVDDNSSQEMSLEFYRDLLELFHCERGCLLRLVVDLSGAVICDKNGDLLQRFELSDIRDVIYSTKKREYSRYFVLVAREESELSVKAHVLFCEDSVKAKELYDTFIEVFTLAAERRNYRRQVSERSAVKDTSQLSPISAPLNFKSIPQSSGIYDNSNSVVNTQDAHAKPPRRHTWTTSSMTSPRKEKTESNELHELNDSFTELARSRSISSSTDINNN